MFVAARVVASAALATATGLSQLEEAGPATGAGALRDGEPGGGGSPLPDDLRSDSARVRKLFLNSGVHDDSANLLVLQLLFLERVQPGAPIELIINSSGGDLYGGYVYVRMRASDDHPRHSPLTTHHSPILGTLGPITHSPRHAILDTMQAISSPVHTRCLGRCRSMAAVLLAAGEPGHRLSYPSARIMLHQPSWELSEGPMREADIRAEVDEAGRQRRAWARLIAKYTRHGARKARTPEELDTLVGF